MLRLITSLVPRRLHRWALRLAFAVRLRWRGLVKLPLRGVAVICRDPAGRLLLVRHSYGQQAWAFPGGGCGWREDPVDAARREMGEELSLPLIRLELLARVEEELSGAPHTAFVFVADVDKMPQPDGREITDARFFAVDDMPRDMGAVSRRWLTRYLQQR